MYVVLYILASQSCCNFEVQPSSWRRGTIWNSSWFWCFLWSGNEYERTCQLSCKKIQLSTTTHQNNSTLIAYEISAIQLVKSFVISRIYYCNSILLWLPKYQQDRLQSVLNVAARLIYGRNGYDHMTDLLRDRLHWLRVTQRITFKYCLFTSFYTDLPSIHHQQLCQKVNYSTSILAALSLTKWLGYWDDQEQVRWKFLLQLTDFGLERTTGVSLDGGVHKHFQKRAENSPFLIVVWHLMKL